MLTYTLLFTDTSATTNYTGLVVTDTYDALLSFVSAAPAPASHNAGARVLTWNLGDVPAGGNKQVILTMQVASEIEAQYALTNTMAWDSAQTTPHTLSKVTAIDVADLHISMSGSEKTYAAGPVAYTIVYSNTGSWNNAPVMLTLDYGPYLNYVSAVGLSPVTGKDNVFMTTLPNDGSNKILTINLTAKAPLPYTLEEITSTVEIASAGAPSQNDDWTVVLRRPIFEFEKMGPPAAAAVNNTMQYTFHLKNTGDYTATNLVITDTWDVGAIFQTSPGWTLDGSNNFATHTVDSLAPGATAVVNPLTVKVTTRKDYYLNEAELSSTQTSIQDTELLIWAHSTALSKTAYPSPAFPTRVVTYTLHYTNTGTGIINAVVVDTLPADFTYQGQSIAHAAGCATGWVFTYNAPYATWRCVAFQEFAAGYFEIWGQVTAAEDTYLVNTAESYGDSIPTRPMDTPLRTLVARPWLRVDKAAAPLHPVAPGDRVTYTLTYENYGTYPAFDVVIKDQLPTQLTFAGCSDGCTHNGGLVTWNMGKVGTATVGTVELYATVKAGTHGKTAVNSNYTIENTTVWQKLTTAETDNGTSVSTVILDPRLTLSKVANPPVAQNINDTVVYTITYQNNGGGTLHNVMLTDTLDIHTGFQTASAGCIHSGEPAGGVVTCQLGTLANGESRQVKIQVAVLTGLTVGQQVDNQAQGDSDETAPTTSNVASFWFQISGKATIEITPQSIVHSQYVNHVTTATLTITNTGALALTWNLSKPTGTTWLDVSPTFGSVPAGDSTQVTLTFYSTNFAAGVYSTTLQITSNDPDHSVVNVPVTFTIKKYMVYLPLVIRGN